MTLDQKKRTGARIQPGRTSKLALDKLICVILTVSLIGSGCWLGYSTDVLGSIKNFFSPSANTSQAQAQSADVDVEGANGAATTEAQAAESEAQVTSAATTSAAAVNQATPAAAAAVAAPSEKEAAVKTGATNTREDAVVDIVKKTNEKHTLSYYWYGLPDGVDFYDAHGSRVFPKVPADRELYEKDTFTLDTTHKAGDVLYVHKGNLDSGEVTGAYTFNGWFDYYEGVMPGRDAMIVGYWSYQQMSESDISKCKVTYSWSGTVPATDVVLKDASGKVVVPTLPETQSILIGDAFTVDATYSQGYCLVAYNSANKKLGTYTFSGWDVTGEVKATQTELVISGVWKYDGESADEESQSTHTVAYVWEGAPAEGLELSKEIKLPESKIVADGKTGKPDSAYTSKTSVNLLDATGKTLGTFTFSGWSKTETDVGNVVFSGKWTYAPKDQSADVPNATNTLAYVWKNAPDASTVLYDKNGKVAKNPVLPESEQLAYANKVKLNATNIKGMELYVHDANGRNSGKYVFEGWKVEGKAAPETLTMQNEAIVVEGEWEFVEINQVAPAVTGKGSVTVETKNGGSKTVTSDTSEGTTPASNTTSNTSAALIEAQEGEKVTVKVKPKDGWYVAQVRYANTPTGYVYGSATPLSYVAILPNSKGEYSFIMPSDHVTLYVDFISIVWDGTIDLTWYNKNSKTFELKYAAQFAGLSAIVNGLFTAYPTSKQTVKAQDGVHTITVDMPDYALFKRGMGVSDDGSALYGTFTSTYTVADSQNDEERFSRSANNTITTRVVGDPSAIESVCHSSVSGDSQNVTTWNGYWSGTDSFKGKTVYITSDLDFGATKVADGKWLTSSPLFMPVGGQYCVIPGVDKTNAYSKLSASFCGTLDGMGHIFKNLYAEYYADTNFGDSQSVGIVGRLGCHDNDDASICPTNPTVRQIVFASGYVSARRSVGGIVGKTGKTTSDYEKGNDGSTGAIVEMCINWASVNSSDKKGCGGIVGAAWNNGLIQYCANFGTITSRQIQNPTGGIAGSNEKLIKNCYNAGKIDAFAKNFAEGITTNNGGNSQVLNSYWLENSAAGGYYGETSADSCTKFGINSSLKTLTASDLNADGSEIWVIAKLPEYYNGSYYYPVLFFQARDEKDE